MRVSQSYYVWCSIFGLVTVGGLCAEEAEEELIDCEGEAATTQFCLDKEEAFELRARIELIYPTLEELSSPPWEEEDFLSAVTDFNKGVDLYRDEYFGDALPKFKAALETFTELEETFQTTAKDKREAIDGLFENSAYEIAVSELDSLLEWFPEDLDLVRLHGEATQGQQLKPFVEELQEHVSTGNFLEVEKLLPQFPDGYYEDDILQVRDSLETHRQDTSFNSSITAAYESIEAKEWFIAEQVLESALLIRPNSTVAQELLAEVSENKRLDQVDELVKKMADAMNTERWEDVLVNVEEVEKLDINEEYDFTIVVEEIDELLALEAELIEYEDFDFSDLNDRKRQDIQLLLDKTSHLNEFDRTQSIRQSLEDTFTRYSTPVKVTVISDNRTKLRIRPGKEIGSFRSKTLEVLPGTYEIVGTRRGFKQVTQKLEVTPDSESIEIKVECRARF
ncbi:MAG: hypothetical protein F4X56_07025 [Gammaproteobacteria bacterium]|nr:hypothetical protein [Gammaproteobacteria bacterium]